MRHRTLLAASAAVLLVSVVPSFAEGRDRLANTPAPPAGLPAAPIAFELVGSYDTLLEGNSAEIAAVSGDRVYISNADDVSVDILDITDVAAPTLVTRVDLSTYGSSVTSVATNGSIVAVAVPAANPTDRGRVVFLRPDGTFLKAVTVGSLPDAVTFTPGGLRVVVSNEGSPNSYGQPDSVDPEGSVTVIYALPRLGIYIPQTISFRDFNVGGRRHGELPAGVRIFGPGATVAQDLEPEYVAVDPNGIRGYVTLQENNALAVVNLVTGRVDRIVALGTKDHSLVHNALDPTDRDYGSGKPGVNIAPWPANGMYQPDNVAAFAIGPRTYVLTADEGDAREYTGFVEEARARAVADTALIPAAGDDTKLGRLTVTTATPATVGANGKQPALYSFGGRSFSIWDDRGRPVWSSGDLLEQLTAKVLPGNFNSTNDANTFDDRSDNKGPEPEAATTGRIGGRTFAFVGLERPGGVVIADVTNPTAPSLVQYLVNRDFAATPVGPDSGPESITFVPPSGRPDGQALLAVSNEVSGTVSFWTTTTPDGPGTLTLLHNNDGESTLLPITNNAGTPVAPILLPVAGTAAFKTVTDGQIRGARTAGNSVVDVYAGDAILASATLQCSLRDPGGPVLDAVAQRRIAYDAHIVGNHELDFTPDFFERFIRDFEINGRLDQPFLSANLDFSPEPGFADLIDPDGLIAVGSTSNGEVVARSAVITDVTTTQRFGIVGATTPTLPTISSPRDVVVTSVDIPTTAAVVQAEVDRLTALGISKVVVVSHLQDVSNDKALVALLRDVDVAVAGGGDEQLANSVTELLPGDPPIQGPYPILQPDATGVDVPIVTTAGNYRYVGRLDVAFDAAGAATVVAGPSGPKRVFPPSAVATSLGLTDAAIPDPSQVAEVETPVNACLTALAAEVVATTETPLDVSRAGVRGRQSNGGNLVADAWLDSYDRYAGTVGLPARGAGNPVVAIQNGGGIRQNAGDVLEAGVLSRLDVINVLPFDNTMVVVEDVSPADIETIFERSAAAFGGGQFLQVAGLDVVYDDGLAVGSRVVSVTLDDGTAIVAAGAPVAAAPNVRIVTNNFTANGGDSYPTLAAKAKVALRTPDGLAIPYEQALREYLLTFPPVAGVPNIAATDIRYAPFPSGEIRITIL